ncbi:Methyltransferase domain-containing protein [Franzmannia pantelleriensis]|uniref:Methyltransferase domain-containing protein n=1 Tax=Franzmannia pantelleriensis TaxID=48727 RepID=A0A1G9G867_9GAMM|nr:class I SAM-dependent methyltransferase [Halomonas pantelleriensis]SDK96772.1 Methyltransferase domain-containing protein [Halomonas pantelleriensis]
MKAVDRSAAGSRFDSDWLALREAADHAARCARLTAQAGTWLSRVRASDSAPLTLVDLGCGRASNPAYLASRLPGPQRWRLVDHDPALLEGARQRLARHVDATGKQPDIENRQVDLADVKALSGLLDGADMVCASALFDLCSADWIEALAEACAARQLAGLFTLSVDGHWQFIDADGARQNAEDDWLRCQFVDHQRRDKGLGAALGGAAPAALASVFEARGYRVERASSPWRLAPGSEAALSLGQSLVAGWATAATEQCPAQAARIEAWQLARQRDLANARCGVWVGHIDLLLTPPGSDG